MNLMKLKDNFFYVYCWCPKSKEANVLNTLKTGSSAKGFSLVQFQNIPNMASSLTPPTSFDLNDFTRPFQVNLLKII